MKTILLTGADGGIGSAIKETLETAGNEVIPITRADADLSSYSDIEKLEQKISAEGTKIDWIVCAHGYIDTETDLEKQSVEAIETTFKINSLSLIYIAKYFLKDLNQGGGMIFLSSSAGVEANGRTAAYSASKAAVNNLAQGLARNRSEFSFISICPGPTNTQMRERLAHDSSTKQSPALIADIAHKIISEESAYKSGDIVSIKDGEEKLVSGI